MSSLSGNIEVCCDSDVGRASDAVNNVIACDDISSCGTDSPAVKRHKVDITGDEDIGSCSLTETKDDKNDGATDDTEDPLKIMELLQGVVTDPTVILSSDTLLVESKKGNDIINNEPSEETTNTSTTRIATTAYFYDNPFPHGIVSGLFQDEFLENVRDEVLHNSKVHFKESDLFRVYQSMDMANLTETKAAIQKDDSSSNDNSTKTHHNTNDEGGRTKDALHLPMTLKLRNLLYSKTFRRYMERLCHLPAGTLLENNQVDCAFNCHTTGCHLLCHDDVISTRKVSYIIYFTDPDWSNQELPVSQELPKMPKDEGGSLELYDTDTSLPTVTAVVPAAVPSKWIVPSWNTMVVFPVEPGKSFHSVQEVIGERPRLSLQGWYHAKHPPKNMELATLTRLKKLKPATSKHQTDSSLFSSSSTAAAPNTVPIPSNHPLPIDNATNVHDTKPNTREGDLHNLDADHDVNNDDNEYVPILYDKTQELISETRTTVTDADRSLSSDDILYLSKYINSIYLEAGSMKEIRSRFEKDSSIQLRSFLINDEYAVPVQSLIQQSDILNVNENTSVPFKYSSKEYYTHGITNNVFDEQGNWELVGPPHMQRYLQYKSSIRGQRIGQETTNNVNTTDKTVNKCGDMLMKIRDELFASFQFGKYLGYITSLPPPTAIQRQQIRRFRRGLDYTVAHYGLLTNVPVLDTTLCFVSGSDVCSKHSTIVRDDESDHDIDDADEIVWQTGDCGGFECYIAADIDDDDVNKGADDEYDPVSNTTTTNNNDTTELLSVHACNNTLSIVYRDPGTVRFIKYVSYNAPSSRYDIAMEYEVPDIDDDIDDDDIDDDDIDNSDDDNNRVKSDDDDEN